MKILGYVLLILGLVVAPALAWFPTAPPSSVASGVTNGDAHDHSGGDGAQIDHTGLANIGTNTHAQIDTHISNAGTIYTLNQGTMTDTYICTYDLASGALVCNTDPAGFGGMSDLVDDTTPQLGGDLDVNGHAITGYLPSIDEDTMSSDSDQHCPTQQSTKAYVDSLAGQVLVASNNLSDLVNKATARSNLEVPYVEKTDCSAETAGCCWDSDDYILYCYDGSDMVVVGRKAYYNLDYAQKDVVDDDLLDWATLADLTYGISSLGSYTYGKFVPVNGLDVDPASKKITVGPNTIFSFDDNNPAADTITRSSGSWITDGIVAGMRVKVSGSSSNDGYYIVAEVTSATVLTLVATDELANESAGQSITFIFGNHYFVVYAPDGNYYYLFSEMGEWYIESLDSAVILPDSFCIGISSTGSDASTGTSDRNHYMPYTMVLDSDGIYAYVSDAPTGSTMIIDVNEGGTTILSTKIIIDAGEKTSQTAATPPVISDTTLTEGSEITFDYDQVGSTNAGKGGVVCFKGKRSW